MRKHALSLLTFLLCTVLLAGCSCRHQWQEATCTTAKHCTECDAVEAEALGHDWLDATCVAPRTCSRCGLTDGNALGHNWLDATCMNAKTCSICAITEGQPLEHIWAGKATLYTTPWCALCGTEGDPLPGYFAQQGLSVNIRSELPADYVTNTYVRHDLETTGRFLASQVEIFESDSSHSAKRGYEWRKVDITISFSDSHAGLYGANVAFSLADYYHDRFLTSAEKRDRFSVTYNDKKYQCMVTYENVEFSYYNNSNVYRMTCYAQVPVGYDGVVLAFYHGSINVSGMHLHEVEDANLLLCRLA